MERGGETGEGPHLKSQEKNINLREEESLLTHMCDSRRMPTPPPLPGERMSTAGR